MKNIFSTILLLFCASIIYAQQNLSIYPKPSIAPDVTSIILLQNENKKPVKKTRVMAKRLIGYSSRMNGFAYNGSNDVRGIFLDSFKFKYTGTRANLLQGDIYDKNRTTIDNYNYVPLPDIIKVENDSTILQFYMDTLNFTFPTMWYGKIINHNTFDTNNFLIQNKYFETYDTLTGTFVTSEKTINVNNAIGLPLESTRYNWNGITQTWDTISSESNTYNANNLITFKQNIVYQVNGTTIIKNYFLYDTNNNLVSSKIESNYNSNPFTWFSLDSIEYIGNSVFNYRYLWNSTNNFWEPNHKTKINYQNNNIVSVYYTNWNATITAWDTIDYRYDTMQYNTNNKMIHYWRDETTSQGFPKSLECIYNRNAVDNLTKFTYIKTNSGNSDTTFQYWNYDADNYLINWTDSVINPFDTNFNGARTTYFYYEAYNNGIPLAISNQTNSIQTATLFPNPAAINTYLSYTTKNEIATKILVMDMQGKIVFTTNEGAALGDHLIKLPIANLNNGLYLVQIINQNNILQTLKLNILH